MKMIVAALIGGIVLGLLDAKILMAEIQKVFTDSGTQSLVATGVAAFLGGIWGWMAKGLFGKAKE